MGDWSAVSGPAQSGRTKIAWSDLYLSPYVHRPADNIRSAFSPGATERALTTELFFPIRHRQPKAFAVLVFRSGVLFLVAAIFEIGGAWLVWQGVREHRGWIWIGGGVITRGLYGFVATLQPEAHSAASSLPTAGFSSPGR